MLPAPALVPVSDQSLLLVWEGAPSDAHSATVTAWFRALRAAAPPWLLELHPAYTTLLVEFDAAQVELAEATAWLQGQSPAADDDAGDRVVEVVVRYGGADGPDLHDVAAHCGLSVDEVVAQHSGVRYRVAFLGFQPGFAYLLGLPPTLHTPRLVEPRRTVAAGSVGIGGGQTGIYPTSGPGGWRLIGRTERPLTPDWIEPGAQLRFVPA